MKPVSLKKMLNENGVLFLDSLQHRIANPTPDILDTIFYIYVPTTNAAEAIEYYFEMCDAVCPFNWTGNIYSRDFYKVQCLGWWKINQETKEWESYTEEISSLKEEVAKLNSTWGL